MAVTAAAKRHAERAAKLDKLAPLVGVLEAMAPGGGEALRDVLNDLHETVAPVAAAKRKAARK